MRFNPDIHHRRSVRLKEYDYSSCGKYFVTICAQDMEMLFGEIVVGEDRADMESAPTLSTLVQSFKRNTTVKYISGVEAGKFPPFNKRVWQRNYYERIIRNEEEYQKIWHYIDTNTIRWKEDRFFV